MDVNEKRIVGVNVSAEPCRFFGTPEGCHYGNECIFRHPGDHERDEEHTPIPAPKVEESEPAASSTPSAPAAPPKRWNVVKTMPNLFSSDDRFPSLGALPRQESSAEDERIKALFALPSKTAEAAEVAEATETTETTETTVTTETTETTEATEVTETTVTTELAVESREEADDNSSDETPAAHPAGSRIHTSSTLVSHEAEADAGEWIDSSSLSSFYSNQQTASTDDPEEDVSNCVACCTGDYSVQNVLLQMNLRVLSYDNKRITQLRVYTRRCRDCFSCDCGAGVTRSVCHDDTKLFCPDCGHASLARVPVFVMKGGIVRIATAFQSKSLRGTKVRVVNVCECSIPSGRTQTCCCARTS